MTGMNKTRGKLTLMVIRKGMLSFVVIGIFLIVLRHLFPGKAVSGGAFDAFCPFGALETLCTYITRGQTLITSKLLIFAVLGGVMMVSLVAGRAFCGWLCPLGAVQEWLAHLSRRMGGEKRHIRGKPSKVPFPLRLPRWADRPLRYTKYLGFGLVILASTAAAYPPLQSFSPARAVFNSKLTTGLLWSVLITFIILSLLVKRWWCKYLCPLGATLGILNKISPVRLKADINVCNHCGRCDTECPMGIQDVPGSLNSTECIRCLECLETCARDEALTLWIGK